MLTEDAADVWLPHTGSCYGFGLGRMDAPPAPHPAG